MPIQTQDPKPKNHHPQIQEHAQPAPGQEHSMDNKPDFGGESYKGHQRLLGKKALITGADSGIGRAVALAFAREGADVMVAYLDEDEDAMETKRLIEDAGRKAVLMPGDVGQEEHCRNIVRTAVREFGHLDILVNNAAFQKTHESIKEITEAELERTFRTNVFGMFYLCKAALPFIREGGSIINSSSIQAFNPDAALMAYAATKAAIYNFTKSFAQEAIKRGIRVNAVAPGPIWTPLIPSTMPQDKIAEFGDKTLLKRPGQPAELAPIYVLLASTESSYVTAQVYGVTGGLPLM